MLQLISMKRLVGEFLGTFCLVFCGTGSIVINEETGGSITHVGVALTFGLIVMSMIFSFGHISGAHMNPAVTIGLSISGRFKSRNIILYIIFQLSGAILASVILKLLFPRNEYLGSTMPSGSDYQSFILEGMLTYILMLVILTSTTKNDQTLIVPALAIGGTAGLEAFFAGPICGASMNPARSIAPAIISGHYISLWIYILAPILGSVLAVLSFKILKKLPTLHLE